MLQAKPRFPNPLGRLAWLLLALLILGGGLIGLKAAFPGAGRFEQGHVKDEVYSFARFQLVRPFLTLEGGPGYLVPVYRRDQVAGALIFTSGRFAFRPAETDAALFKGQLGHELLSDRFDAVFIQADYPQLENLRYQLGAGPAADGAAEDGTWGQGLAVLDQAEGFLTGGKLGNPRALGIPPMFVPAAAPSALHIFARDYGHLIYSAGPRVTLTLVDSNHREASLPNPETTAPPDGVANKRPVLAATLASLAAALLLIAVLLVLTADLEGRTPMIPWRHLPSPRGDRDGMLFALALVAAQVVAGIIQEAWALPQFFPGMVRIILALTVVGWVRKHRRPAAFIGLDRHNLARGLGLAVLLGLAAMVVGSLALPTGVRSLSALGWLATAFGSFVGLGLAGEVCQRGFVQARFEEALGHTGGLLACSWLLGLASFIPQLAVYRAVGSLALVEGLVVLPVTFAIFGLLFQRTHNVFASALLRGLLDFLPRVLLI